MPRREQPTPATHFNSFRGLIDTQLKESEDILDADIESLSGCVFQVNDQNISGCSTYISTAWLLWQQRGSTVNYLGPISFVNGL